MSDGFGLGDGQRDLSTMHGEADARVMEAQRPRPDRAAIGWWPSGGAIVQISLAVAGAIVVIGWLLTALRSPS